MEKNEIYKLEIGKKIQNLKLSEENVESTFEITFIDGSIIKFGSHHNQDCCESVYADYTVLKYHLESLKDKQVNSISIKPVKEMGFVMNFNCKWKNSIKVFIPCYNYQNGYYGSDLYLTVNNRGVEIKVDISELVEDNIEKRLRNLKKKRRN